MGGVLPVEYQQVEYLEGDGSPYINLGFTYAENRGRLKCKIYPMQGSYSVACRFTGCSQSNPTNNSLNIFPNVGSSSYMSFYIGQKNIPTTSLSSNHLFEIDMTANNGSYTVNYIHDGGNTIQLTGTYTASIYTPQGVYMMGHHEYGNLINYIGRCYYYQAYNDPDGLPVLDLYPCYRKSDNKPGMYDTVSETFFTNSGTGEFTVGNPV